MDCLSCVILFASVYWLLLEDSIVYTTRFPFCTPLYQAHLLGVTDVFIKQHEWESYYKDEFRRANRLAKDLGIKLNLIEWPSTMTKQTRHNFLTVRHKQQSTRNGSHILRSRTQRKSPRILPDSIIKANGDARKPVETIMKVKTEVTIRFTQMDGYRRVEIIRE